MFLNIWSLALTFCGAIAVFLVAVAARTGWRVLRHWDPASDDALQIGLESETWLASTLVEYGLALQILTLLLFILAADQFSHVIAGAMCATGSLLADPFGMPTLYLKLSGVFLYGCWLLLHQLDIRVETYPLVRSKFIYLLCLLPFLLADVILQTFYIAGLKPDIITSCCSVVFAEPGPDSGNLMGIPPRGLLLAAYYGTILGLGVIGALLLKRRVAGRLRSLLTWLYAISWAGFFFLALAVITSILSCYIYAMPNHRCPFCLLKPEYHYIGLGIYFALIGGAFFGVSTGIAVLISRHPDLTNQVARYLWTAVKISLGFLVVFTILTSYHYLRYLISGGE
ncbi:MAG: hypothetical protein HGA96_01305 [Desulfobulbaceae bacterium]|nr:hypothetical protein [Desulfobulbaceae bacterium]